MSVRRDIKPALTKLWAAIHTHRLNDAALLRLLREFGIECYRLGVEAVHTAPTLPAPERATKPAPPHPADDTSGRYALHHYLHRREDTSK